MTKLLTPLTFTERQAWLERIQQLFLEALKAREKATGELRRYRDRMRETLVEQPERGGES